MEPVYHSVLDPMVALGYAAAVTERIRLGVAVLNMPYPSPAIVAKQAASVDVLSGGRHDLGLGIGWMPEEFALTGGTMAGRGARTAEYLDVLRRLWAGEVTEFDGEHYTVPAGPVRPPCRCSGPVPPILLGGLVPRALVRAGRLADGWVTSSRADLTRIGESVARGPGGSRAGGPGPGADPDRLPGRGPLGRAGDRGPRAAAGCRCRAASTTSAPTPSGLPLTASPKSSTT